MAATKEGPNDLDGLIEQPSMGIKNKWDTMTLIAMGNTPRGPPPADGISIVANTQYTVDWERKDVRNR